MIMMMIFKNHLRFILNQIYQKYIIKRMMRQMITVNYQTRVVNKIVIKNNNSNKKLQ